jgi:transposase
MMGSHQEQGALFSFQVNLEQRIRQDHPLRAVRKVVDFSFVRQEVARFYGVNGNESIDPEIIMKLMFLLFFDNIPSERALMDMLPERLDYLWFLGYGLDDKIPNHSVLSKARARWGAEVFEALFARTVVQCVQSGLVDGTKVHMDGSLVAANASVERITQGAPALVAALRETLSRESAKLDTTTASPAAPNSRVNTTDPDASLVTRKGKGTGMRYKVHRAVDDAHGVITANITTPGHVSEDQQAMALLDEHEQTTGCKAQVLIADCQYGVVETYRQCAERDVTCHAADYSTKNLRKRKGGYPAKEFEYDEQTDTYRCPAGQTLKRRCYDPVRQRHTYYTDKGICAICPLRAQCTKAKNGAPRQIKRYIDQPAIERYRRQAQSAAAKRDRRRRRYLMEGSFADAANNHGFGRARWRTLVRQRIQGALIAAIQNVRILLSRPVRPLRSAQSMAILGPHKGQQMHRQQPNCVKSSRKSPFLLTIQSNFDVGHQYMPTLAIKQV